VEIQAGADNAGTSNGLGALLLAKIPLEKVPGLLRRWAAEVKQTTGITVSAP
jgi:hypothetical protein